MPADVAEIGLKIDTRPIQSATTALNQLTTAARPAEQAVAKFESAAGKGGAASKQLAAQTGLARFEMINLSRQVQDVGVSLASGQSPFLILVQQGTQIADIFSSSQGSLRGFASQLRGMLTPAVLLAGGFVTLGAATVGALTYWKNFALTLDDTARAAGIASGEMAKLQAAAAFKGVGSDDFAKGVQGFAAELYRAKNNAGELREVFRVNGIQARDFSTALEKVADLVQRSTSYQEKLNILQKANLPTTAEFVRFMDQGAEGIRKAKDQAAGFGGAANEQMMKKAREFDEAWAKAWTNFSLGARTAIVSVTTGISSLMEQATNISSTLRSKMGIQSPQEAIDIRFPTESEFLKPFSKNKPTVDPDAIRDVERMSDAIQRMTDMQKVELTAQGMSVGAAAQFRVVQEQIIDARQRHIKLSDETIAKLNKEAEAYGRLVQATALRSLKLDTDFERAQLGRDTTDQQIAAKLRVIWPTEYASHMKDPIAAQMRFNATLQTTKQLSEDALAGFITDMMQGKNATDALNNALKNFEAQLIRIASNRLISGLFAAGEQAFNPVGTHHGGYGPGDPIPIRLLPRFHSGVGPGERPAVIRSDESVLTPGQMKALGQAIGGSGGIAVTVNNAPAGTQAQASTSRDENGAVRIDVWLQRHIDDTAASLLDTGESNLNRTFERRYGLVPRL